MSLGTLLCAMGHSHAGIEKGLPQFVPAKLEALSEMSCYADALRFLFTGIKGTSLTLEKQPPYHYPHLHQTWKFSWHPPNPECPSDRQTEKRASSLHRTGFHCSRVQWWCALHTPFRQFVLYLVVWLGACSCLATENHSLKLLPCSFCADINASRSLELFSHEINRALVTFAHHVSQHSMTCSVTLRCFEPWII